MSSPTQSPGRQDSGGPALTGSVACNGCRKSKLRCSRERPTCSHCSRSGSDCVYETKRTKPGIKPGAIESIQKRLDALERRLDQGPTRPRMSADRDQSPNCFTTGDQSSSDAASVLALLAKELPKLVASSHRSQSNSTPSPGKRRRVDNATPSTSHVTDDRPPLPPPELIQSHVDVYFTHIHPWIPMLNQDRFRQQVDDPRELPNLEVILHSIAITVSKYLPGEDHSNYGWSAEDTRTWVVMTAMQTQTLQSLQALIILVFNDIGSGNATKAWSIIASLTRTVEYLQLTIDSDGGAAHAICRPFSYLGPPRDWVEEEERRRVFWSVFLLDRFCSITMGWNTSLTSIDVHQRLPCEGILWRKQEAGSTPYLGIWDKSTGGMGNMSTTAAGDQCQPALDIDRRDKTTAAYPDTRAPDTDVSRIGAFAYCVEATESMSRVTAYFLQQRINPNDPEAVNAWLARFKELDLRLVHWKMFLPQKWKPNMPHQASRMDPNLTLAHLTHNASTILLHQLIAWPPPSWPFRKKLPSVWSAETCCSAGIEIATITKKYLENTPDSLPITSSFDFCVYIAARMMLVHWRHDPSNHRLEDFFSLTSSLDEISRRWRGPYAQEDDVSQQDLAAKYAAKLRGLYQRCLDDEGFRIHVEDYAQEIDHRAPAQHPRQSRRYSENGSRQPYPNQPDLGQQQWAASMQFANMGAPTHVPSYSPSYRFTAASQMMDNSTDSSGLRPDQYMAMDEYFVDMDRVISFNDGSLFSAGVDDGLC